MLGGLFGVRGFEAIERIEWDRIYLILFFLKLWYKQLFALLYMKLILGIFFHSIEMHGTPPVPVSLQTAPVAAENL